LLLAVVLPLSLYVDGAAGAAIWTGKPDYAPGECVTIFGSGFLTDATVRVQVTRPDTRVNSWNVISDASGNFATNYQLDGIVGTYTVTATDGTNTATTTFTDDAPSFSFAMAPTRTTTLQTRSYTVTITGENPIRHDIGSATISFETPAGWGTPSGMTLTPPTGKSWSVGTGSDAPSAGILKVHANQQLYENYNTGDDAAQTIIGDTWRAQTFSVGSTAHTVTSVRLKLYKQSGASGTLTAGIRNTDGSGHPTGSDLTSGTYSIGDLDTDTGGAWVEITMTPYSLAANRKYAIVARSDSTKKRVYWRVDTSPTYAEGNEEDSTDSGSSWTFDTTRDFMFEVWARNELVAGDVLTIGSRFRLPQVMGFTK